MRSHSATAVQRGAGVTSCHRYTLPQDGDNPRRLSTVCGRADRPPPDPGLGMLSPKQAAQSKRTIALSNLYDAAAARVARGIVRLAANRVNVVFSFPDGSRWGPSTPTTPEFRVIDPDSFYRRLGRNAKMAFGEAYVAGDWTSGPDTDLADLLTPFAEKLTTLLPGPVRKLRRVIDRRLPHHTHNTREGAKSNVSAHYDMSNELFKAFLDDTLTYSCAWFDDLRNEPLETAQLRKIDGILDYAEVTTGTNLLEIGSGWGSLAIRAAQRGATVTSITLSQEQANLRPSGSRTSGSTTSHGSRSPTTATSRASSTRS